MDNQQIAYVVFGSTGEYSDHEEWVVQAFTDERVAMRFVAACDAHGRHLRLEYEAAEDDVAERFIRDYKGRTYDHPYDPNFTYDYSGFNYYYVACPLDQADLMEAFSTDDVLKEIERGA
ncbi:MAG: hypothetical protein LC687_07835 [Actinobacteria bacterium]|nr:hypothetical protein [Actinomycetota bacterium]